MDLPKHLAKAIKTRLQSIGGQIRGLARMLDSDVDPEKLLIQFKAAQHALDKTHYLLLDEAYRKTLALKIVETVNACPGNCGNEGKVEFIRKEFPNLAPEDLSKKLREISGLQKRIKEFKALRE